MYIARSGVTAEQVRIALSYDSETGEFIWLKGSNPLNRRVGRTAGSLAQSGYICISVHGVSYLAHRLAWLHVHGVWPAAEIDHINGIRHDNRLVNLREADHSLNMANARVIRKSRLKGTSRCRDKWQARITVGQKTTHLGTFSTAQQAHAAYVAAAKKLFGPFAFDGNR